MFKIFPGISWKFPTVEPAKLYFRPSRTCKTVFWGAKNPGQRGAKNLGQWGAKNPGQRGAKNPGQWGAKNPGQRGAKNLAKCPLVLGPQNPSM